VITDIQKIKLITAIDKAEGHGSLAYTVEGRPACVIAQLALLEGASVNLIKKWDDSVFVILGKSSTPKGLKEYPSKLLQYLQFLWDDRTINHTVARERMRELVYAAADVYSDKDTEMDKLAQQMGLPTISGLESSPE
jgi:hypothetical protein